jgi:MFS family permease
MQEPGPSSEQGAGATRLRERYSLLFSLLLPALLLGLGRGFTMPVLPIIARDEFGVGAAAATFTIIATMLGSVLATLPTGYLIDRIGRRKILITGPFITALSSFLVLIADSYAEMLAYLMLNGVALQMWMMGRLAAIADTGKQGQRGRMITGMAGLQRAGTLLGPFLGGLVGTFIGLRAPFAMYGVMALLATIPMILLIKETAPGVLAKRRGEKVEDAAGSSWGSLLTFPVIVLFIAQFTANIARGGTAGNSGPAFIFAAYAFGLDAIGLGTISLITGVVGIPATFLAGYIMDRFGRKRCVVPASAVLGAGLGLMALTAAVQLPLTVFVASFVLANLAVSFMAGSMQTIGSDIAPAGARGKFFGLARLTASSGSLANPVLFAVSAFLVALPGGYALGFAMMGASGVLTSVLVGRLLKETLVRQSAAPIDVAVAKGSDADGRYGPSTRECGSQPP